MMSTSHKVVLLAKAGVLVPPFPARRFPVQERYLRPGARIPQIERDADEEQRIAVDAWSRAVDRLYEELVASRAVHRQVPEELAQSIESRSGHLGSERRA